MYLMGRASDVSVLLDVDPLHVDLTRFEQLAELATQNAAREDLALAAPESLLARIPAGGRLPARQT
jgi:hypothetical protein